ncbi:hypothetical protein D3C87_1001800 [compost metagenome]
MTFNLTAKRIQALEFIEKHPGCMVGAVAQKILAGHRTGKSGLWSQQATRAGAGYCQALEKQGLVTIDRYVDCGYGEVRITCKGRDVIRSSQAQLKLTG